MIDERELDLGTGEKLKQTRGEHFIKIWDFMLGDLKLEKTELIVYAVIFAMHRNYCECFVGSREYLQGWTNASKKSIDRALLSLESKNLVRKEYRKYGPIRKAVYFVNTEALPSCEMFRLENRNRDNNERIRRAKETLKNHT